MNPTTIAQLTLLDPAPAAELTAAGHARREEILQRILADPGPSPAATRGTRTPVRSRLRTLSMAGAAVVAAGAAAAALLAAVAEYRASQPVPGSLTSAELAAWSGVPHRLSLHSAAGGTAQSWCLSMLSRAPAADISPVITNADVRGQVASLVISRGGYTFFCLTGGDGTGLWETIAGPSTPPAAPAPGQITLDTEGSHGDGSTGYTYAEGLAGTGVTALTIHDAGQVISAAIEHGRWTAWWPTPDPHGAITGDVVITTGHGTTRISGSSLLH
jgi:hypothetical protein